MILQNSTWIEVETYLKKSKGILIPIGSTEQHGPNGLIGTDAVCPEVIAQGVSETYGVLVAPTINYGMAQHHMAFPGTIALRPSTLIQVIVDVISSLSRHGFEHLYFLNGHGGNIAPVNDGFSEFYSQQSYRQEQTSARVLTKLVNWWKTPGVLALTQALFAEAEGWHATPSEVSLSYYARPDSVKQASLDPTIAPSGPFFDANDFRKRFPDGRIGSNPGLASVEYGERYFQLAVKEVAEDFQRFCTKY